jgi:hypothetical protein
MTQLWGKWFNARTVIGISASRVHR